MDCGILFYVYTGFAETLHTCKLEKGHEKKHKCRCGNVEQSPGNKAVGETH